MGVVVVYSIIFYFKIQNKIGVIEKKWLNWLIVLYWSGVGRVVMFVVVGIVMRRFFVSLVGIIVFLKFDYIVGLILVYIC